MRFLAGGVGFAIPINPHLLTSCYFGALAMALVKRRIELSAMQPGAPITRPSLKGVTLPVVDLLVGVFAATAIGLFAQWTIVSGKPVAIFTLPFLSIFLARIVWLAYLSKKGEDFSKTMVTDAFSLIASAFFLLSLAAAIYS